MKTWKRMSRKRRRRQFNKAYRILRREHERHLTADHLAEFEAVNESYLLLRCTECPELLP